MDGHRSVGCRSYHRGKVAVPAGHLGAGALRRPGVRPRVEMVRRISTLGTELGRLRRIGRGNFAQLALTDRIRCSRQGASGRGRATGSATTPGRRHGRDDAVLVDLAVDRRPGHSQGFRRLRLVALRVEQALHDRVALQGLQRAEQPAAHRPAFGRQVVGVDRAGTAVVCDPPEYLPELLDGARPAGPQEKLERPGGAGEPALGGGPREETRYEARDVLARGAPRWAL